MRKLSLKIDDLQIESFDTSPESRRERGTFKGHEATADRTDCSVCGTGTWCQGQTTGPCWAGTYEGNNCDSTGLQLLCGCTYGGENNGTCDAICNSAGTDCTNIDC